MSKKILVPLGQNDRTEEIIPCVEKVARPGMTVVFLVPYPIDGILWPKEKFGMKAALEARKLASYYSWEENLERAKRKISPAIEAFRPKGVEVAVEVYCGSLKKAVRYHTLNGDVHLIMTSAGIGEWIARFLDGTVSIFQLFNRPTFSPVLLIQPPTLL